MTLTDEFDTVALRNDDAEPLVAPRLPLSDGVPGAAVKALVDEQMPDHLVAQARADGGRLPGRASIVVLGQAATLARRTTATIPQPCFLLNGQSRLRRHRLHR